jgi:sulfonate transport system substrate-binding protein
MTSRRSFLIGGSAVAAAALAQRSAASAAPLDQLGIDYAYYNPASLILKQQGWLEEALGRNGTKVNWVLSLGSNKANGFLAANAVQFGSTAGSAAFLARANGSPIRTGFLYSRPEWTALVVAKDSPLRSVTDLRGKKVAATRGTDPWFFLIRSLRKNGLDLSDIELVDLQHPDGRSALERGQVDAWAGLDPFMAASQLDAGSRLLYRNPSFNTFGALNAREDFLAAHPDVVSIVLQQYDRARKFAIAHPQDAAKAVSDAAHLDLRVATLQITQRTEFPDPIPGAAYRDAVGGVVPIVRSEHLVANTDNLVQVVPALIDAKPARVALVNG